ncbi:MAG: ribonuclease H-like domain-containing protein [Dokdonella sp.]
MSELASRLRTLRMHAGVASAASTNPSSSEIGRRLRGLVAGRERMVGEKLIAPGGTEVAPGVYLVERNIAGAQTASAWMPWGDLGQVERHRLVCFDTETTGLAGGVGTRAFMIGALQWQGDAMRVRQLYLTTMAGEPAMLRIFASWLSEDSVFISYNGRSYDAPLLKGRYRLNRLPCPFAERGHVDLLYPTRRAWRGVWENCRLATIERHLLGIVREDDLPGSEAPAAWLAYLRGVSATNLGRVIAHNDQDVVTLAALLDRLQWLPLEAVMRCEHHGCSGQLPTAT